MYDKELIERICNLTCDKDDLKYKEDAKYDSDHPFKKYYDAKIIVRALNKYNDKEWTDNDLANWCYKYLWILDGGYVDNANEDLNPLEKLFKDMICWEIDGLSFFREEDWDDFNGYLDGKYFITMDHIWQTIDDWKGIYAPIGKYDIINGDQYVLLINDKSKEYAILFSEGFLKNYYKNQNEYLRYTTSKKFNNKIEKLKTSNYKIINCCEDSYYEDLNSED